MPKVWDCVMLNGELDMLECRLRELPQVWRHVIVESPVTHRGGPKPLHYAANRERFAAWADRIIHVVAGGLPPWVGLGPDPVNPWAREHTQRDAAQGALADAGDDDVVLIADVDEFPPALFPLPDPVLAFDQRLCMYAVDWEYPELHRCTVAARMGYIRQQGSLAAVRDGRYGYPGVSGGWHLTWLGGVEAQRAKLATICHTEMTGHEASLIRDGRCYREGIHHSGQLMMRPVDVDSTWPEMIWKRECPASWFRPR